MPKPFANKTEFGWCMYDWANSAFATVVLTAVLPIYFASLVPAGGVPVFWSGEPLPATAFWGYVVSISMALVALLAPGFGNLADRRGWRKFLLVIFCLIGSLATAALSLAGPGRYLLAAGLFIVGNIGFALGNVFYNAFLPGLAKGPAADRLSSWGFALGYLGGGLMLALVFVVIRWHTVFGLPDPAVATRVGFFMTGLWWIGFALPTFFWVPEEKLGKADAVPLHTPRDYLQALSHLRRYPDLLRFLLAYLLYNDGIHTVVAVSAIFAREELGFDTGTILGCFLMIQFVAMPGALIFSGLARRYGSKGAILVSLVVFTAIAVYASRMETTTEFWVLGFVVAIVLGGSQAISRSLFSKMLPETRSAEFFSFFAISAKFASIFGPLIFALIIDLTGSNRLAILALSGFFLGGIFLLTGVDTERGKEAAQQ